MKMGVSHPNFPEVILFPSFFSKQPFFFRGESNKRKELTSIVQTLKKLSFHPPEAPRRGAGLWTWEVFHKKKTNQQKKAATQGRRRKPEENDVRHVLVFRGFCTDVFLSYSYFGGNDTNLTHIFQRWLKPPTSVAVDLLKVIFYGFHHGKSPSNKKMWIHVGNILSFPTTLSNSKVVEKNMVKQLYGLPPLKCVIFVWGFWYLREGMM